MRQLRFEVADLDSLPFSSLQLPEFHWPSPHPSPPPLPVSSPANQDTISPQHQDDF